ncbi:MAG TPA: ABC transporter ATP-binding protein [Vicinamibacterales bacterium]|nr:ABC transporter ATP-binding protein [Vicinamibacterales bacterium]
MTRASRREMVGGSVDFDEVSVEDVSRHFGRRRAVSRVTFRAARGMIVGLLGPNGAGKSTLLAMLATVLRPSSGAIRYGSLDATAGPALRSRIGVLGHDLFLYPELTARENLAFFAGLYGIADSDACARAALERAQLDTRRDDPVASFSRGMRQRVALERALIHDPRLALLDEPFTGLDDASTEALLGRLKALRHGGAIVILATHDLDLAEGLLDTALFLRDGRNVETLSAPGGLRSTYRTVIGR